MVTQGASHCPALGAQTGHVANLIDMKPTEMEAARRQVRQARQPAQHGRQCLVLTFGTTPCPGALDYAGATTQQRRHIEADV